MLKLTFLGTSAGIPTAERNMSSTAIEFSSKRIWLVDCGAGTQQQMIKAGMWIGRVDRILITHLHGDHCFDIVGLLALRGMRKIYSPVEVIGPVGIKELIETTARLSGLYLPYKLHIVELEENVVHDLGWRSESLSSPEQESQGASSSNDAEDLPTTGLQTLNVAPEVEREDWKIVAYPLDHRIACFGYVFVEKMQLGAFDASIAISKGVSGKDIGKLAQTGTVVLSDGKSVNRSDCLKPSFSGRKFVILGDTHTCNDAFHKGAADADVLVHEATFENDLADLALRSKHSTTHMAVDCAIKCNARKLYLTHFSARYTDHGGPKTVDNLLDEATAHADGKLQVLAAKDFLTVDIPPRKAPIASK